MGPTFTLTLWATDRLDKRGQTILGYRLTMREPGARCATTLFEGEDFAPSPLDAIDSDATVAAVLTFLTLRPGDTDAEYFAAYTPAQFDYCAAHAEALAVECIHRFGEGSQWKPAPK
jgi:hypothetical protein